MRKPWRVLGVMLLWPGALWAQGKEFGGHIGRTVAESVPDYPQPVRARAGSPSVLYILLDDTGFADLGAYGSEVQTPSIDALARQGLRFNNFHTRAVCSPSRAALLTGRNSHSVGMGNLSHVITGFPGKRGEITHAAATVAELLRASGYSTYALGKWHLAPPGKMSSAGSLDQWPLQRGFERYYGFIGGMADQYHPTLMQDNTPIDPPESSGYHLSTDLVDHAIGYLKEQIAAAPEKPFFMYLAFGATHAPHQVPERFVEKYVPVFGKGWDRSRADRFARQKALGVVPPGTRLNPRDEHIPAWDSLGEAEKKIAVRFQAVYGGFLEHTDAEIGRLVEFLERSGRLENTIVVVLSDNGTSPEGELRGTYNETLSVAAGVQESTDEQLRRLAELGTDRTYANYPMGWAQVGNVPFSDFKHSVDLGGLRAPLIVHWPKGIQQGGGVRSQFVDIIDVTPTVLAISGVEVPEVFEGVRQLPLEGASIAAVFTDAAAPSARKTQYFELWGKRSLLHEGWFAASAHERGTDFDRDPWRLYDLGRDFSASRDVAKGHPEILADLQRRWWEEARKYRVLPLDDRPVGDPHFQAGNDGVQQPRVYAYYPAQGSRPYKTIPTGAAPETTNRSFTIEAVVDRKDASTEGVILAMGDRFGGYVLYVRDKRLYFDFNDFGTHTVLVSDTELPVGRSTVAFEFRRVGDFTGTGRLSIDGRAAGEREFTMRPAIVLSWAGMDVGRDVPSPVSDAYADKREFAFPASQLTEVTITVWPVTNSSPVGPADPRPAFPAAPTAPAVLPAG